MMTDRFSFGPILFLPVRPKCAITWQGGQSGGRGITGICTLHATDFPTSTVCSVNAILCFVPAEVSCLERTLLKLGR